MIKVYLVRHGETEWNKIGKMQGWGDSPLSELGREQAKWLGERANEFKLDRIYTSPTGRAYETAEIIKGVKDIEIIKRDSIREINVGEWEGLDKEIVKRDFEEAHYKFWNEPHNYEATENGEDFFEVGDRVFQGIMEIIKSESKDDNDKSILIVSHAIAIKGFLCKLEEKEVKDFWEEPLVGQTSLTEINFDGDSYEIILKGDTTHYKYGESLNSYI